MGKTVWKKLRSRKGASLTFALLAFLVCAVISAVLLASASASAGRLSGLAEADRRYYAVASAAQLFCDELSKDMKDGDNVKYFKIKWWKTEMTDYKIIITTLDQTDTRNGTLDSPNYEFEFTHKFKDKDESTDSNPLKEDKVTFLTEAAMYLAFGQKLDAYKDSMTGLAGYTFESSDDFTAQRLASFPKEWKFTIAESTNNADYTGLKVEATATMSADGKILVEFTNYEEDTSAPQFSIVVELVPNGFKGNYTEDTRTFQTTDSRYIPANNQSMVEIKKYKTTTRSVNVGWTIGNVTKMYHNSESTPVTDD